MEKENLTDSFMKLRSRLRMMAASLLSNEEDAEDALQDAFCRLWAKNGNRSSEFWEGAAVLAVKRTCLSLLRKRAVRNSSSIDDSVSPVEHRSIWEEREIQKLSDMMVSCLPPLQKRVFEMVSDGIDYDIIAVRLGISEQAVRQNISRARKRLRDEYRKIQ